MSFLGASLPVPTVVAETQAAISSCILLHLSNRVPAPARHKFTRDPSDRGHDHIDTGGAQDSAQHNDNLQLSSQALGLFGQLSFNRVLVVGGWVVCVVLLLEGPADLALAYHCPLWREMDMACSRASEARQGKDGEAHSGFGYTRRFSGRKGYCQGI